MWRVERLINAEAVWTYVFDGCMYAAVIKTYREGNVILYEQMVETVGKRIVIVHVTEQDIVA
jgi:(2Fe-2S) ferredoxin